MHCEDPICARVCPADAIKQTPDGVTQSSLKPRCIGCSNCVLACPFGVPKLLGGDRPDDEVRLLLRSHQRRQAAHVRHRLPVAGAGLHHPRGDRAHAARPAVNRWVFGDEVVQTKVMRGRPGGHARGAASTWCRSGSPCSGPPAPDRTTWPRSWRSDRDSRTAFGEQGGGTQRSWGEGRRPSTAGQPRTAAKRRARRRAPRGRGGAPPAMPAGRGGTPRGDRSPDMSRDPDAARRAGGWTSPSAGTTTSTSPAASWPSS